MAFTITGGVSLSGVSYMPPPPPPLPGSLLFNTTKYLTLPSSDNFTFTGDFTIECWIYVPSISNTIQRIFSSNAGPGGACYFSVGNDIGTGAGAGKLCANGHLVPPYTAGFITASTAIPINTWIHVALVRNGSTITIYQNGVSVASATDSATWDFNNSAGVRISGTPWAGSSEDLNGGYITNFRAVKGTAVYTGNFTPSTSPLTAIANTSLLLNSFQGADFLKDTSTNNFTVTNNNGVTSSNESPMPVECLVVAGGGGGGARGAGGGGAGGLLTASNFAVTAGTALTVTVGAGGAGGVTSAKGSQGSNSIFSSITSTGGGGGGTHDAAASNGGGSGGGGGDNESNNSGVGGTGISGQGNSGGTGATSAPAYVGGGGGGASAVGGNGNTGTNTGGVGGAGTSSSITGTSATYAGGGGGSSYSGTGGSGGTGGGGAAYIGNTNGQNGTENTGGGGGAGGYPTSTGGTGGSGIVIIRYADTYPAAASTTGSPTITVVGGYRVYKWTTSGTITF